MCFGVLQCVWSRHPPMPPSHSCRRSFRILRGALAELLDAPAMQYAAWPRDMSCKEDSGPITDGHGLLLLLNWIDRRALKCTNKLGLWWHCSGPPTPNTVTTAVTTPEAPGSARRSKFWTPKTPKFLSAWIVDCDSISLRGSRGF